MPFSPFFTINLVRFYISELTLCKMKLLLSQLTFSLLTIYCVYCISSRCELLKPCRCYYQNNYVEVDCSGTNVTSGQICDACKIIRNISVMDVSATTLSEIPPFCFQDCYNVLELSIADNNISRFDNNTFVGVLQLKSLNLNGNRLIKKGNLSNPNFLAPLRNLQSLSLKLNTHETDDKGIRFYLPNVGANLLSDIHSLYLDGLPNAEFGDNFSRLKNLKRIDFSGVESSCKIASLNNRSFENVPFLTHLDLSHCSISDIDAGTFKSLTELKYLNLCYNMGLGFAALRSISYGLQFTKLEVLDYSKVYKTFGLTTQLNRCDVWFLRNTTIKELHLNSNRLALPEINALALFPPLLEKLSIEDNKLSFGPYTWQTHCLKNLKIVEASYQSLTHSLFEYNKEIGIQEKTDDTSGGCEVLDSDLNCTFSTNTSITPFDLTAPEKLETLIYRSSRLILDPIALHFHIRLKNSLRSLDISGNGFSNLYGLYIYLEKLENLSISDNYCTHISTDFFTNCPNTKFLDISNNKLGPFLKNDTYGTVLKPLTKLVDLDLSNNWIEILSTKVFAYSSSLEIIRLSSNRIKTISFEFEHMKNLSGLYLTQNEISTLPLNLLYQMDNYSKLYSKNVVIDLSRNMLSLSCDNLDFLRWLKEHSNYFTDIQSYTFRRNNGSVINYANFVASFDGLQKSCRSYTAVIIVSTLCMSVFFSLIVGGLMYRYRWRLRYLYYIAKARYKGYQPLRHDEVERVFKYDAFISYATENYQFVTQDMLHQLEEAGLTLCLHQKDFIPGSYIAENILQAIKNSKMTVIVLTNEFLDSKWCMYEFNMARMESIYSRNGENTLIVVKYKDFDMARVSTELRDCLESESYLDYTQDENEGPYFWQMLAQAIRG